MFSTWFSTWLSTWTEAQNDRGAALVEYAFLMMLVAFVALTMVTFFGATVLELFTSDTAKMSYALDLSNSN